MCIKRPDFSTTAGQNTTNMLRPSPRGSHLLRKLGWNQGEGLGKNKQGITRPIVARPHFGLNGLKCQTEKVTRPTRPFAYTDWVRAREDIISASINTSIRRELPEIIINFEGNPITTLLDTGSELTCLSEEVYNSKIKELDPPTLPLKALIIQGAFGTRSKRITRQILLNIEVGGKLFETCFLIVAGLIRPCILGADWLQNHNCILNFTGKHLEIHVNKEPVIVPFSIEIEREFTKENTTIEPEETEIQILQFDQKLPNYHEIIDSKVQECKLQDEDKQKLRKLLLSFTDIFSEKPGLTPLYQHEIKLIDRKPFVRKSYPVPFALRPQVEKKLEEMVKEGIIERTSSPYCSPMTVVKKRDESIRICLDARALNEKMVSDLEGPPAIDELLQRFHGKVFLSNIDLVSSFWQIGLTTESRKYTTFMYNGRSYCYKVLPFGLKTSVASFSRCMDIVLGPDVRDFTHNYIDDLLIASSTFEEHLNHIQTVCRKLRDANLKINIQKSHFVRNEVTFLGHVLTPLGIKKDQEKVKAIMEFPKPTKIKHLRAFLGLCNYYRKFCKNYSDYPKKLSHLLKKGTPWKWGQYEEESFNEIKQQFVDDVVLIHPDPKKLFILETDASNYGIGAVLYQVLEDGRRGVIAFQSRSLRGPEINYVTTEKELLSVVYSLHKFRLYLTGTQFLIRTDHKALTFLKTCRFLNERITRWLLQIQQFDFKIEYIRGAENIVADILSRYPSDGNLEGDQQFPVIASFVAEGARELLKDFKNIQYYQESDCVLGKIRAHLQRSDTVSDPNLKRILPAYHLENGILIHQDPHKNHKTIAVPTCLQKRLTWQYHQEMGHFGGQKVFTVMKHNFHWPNMRRQIKHLLQTCDLCQKTKKPNHHLEGPLNPIIAREIGEIVAVDFYGPLPKGKGGVAYVLVAVDIFSKFVKLFPMKKATATAAVNRIIKDYLPIIPIKRILSDHGSQFTSDRWKKPLQEQGIKITYATVRNARSNPSERYMKELGRLCRTYCHKRHKSWNNYIRDMEECLNSIPHSSTGRSAFEIIAGRKHGFYLNKVIDMILPKQVETPEEIRESVWQMLIKTSQKRVKQQKRPPYMFQLDCLVLLKTNPTSKAVDGVTQKFHLVYDGPYRITKIVRENVYEISYLHNGVKKGTYNTHNLRPYHSDT